MIRALIFGVFGYFTVRCFIHFFINSSMETASSLSSLSSSSSSAASLAGTYTSMIDGILGGSFWSIFLWSALLGLAIYLCMALVNFIVHGSIMKAGGTFMDYLNVNAGAAAFTSIFSIVAILASFIHFYALLAVVVFIIAAYFVLTTQGYKAVVPAIDDNKYVYGIALAALVTAVVAYFITNFASEQVAKSLTSSALTQTNSLNSGSSSNSSTDYESLFKNLMK